jgi:choline dehydrogenase-like flavoprotein
VELRSDGSHVLDYQMTPYTWVGIRRAYHSMAEIQFAAGATRVFPVHADADYVTDLTSAKNLIDGLDLSLYRARLGSAHVMGGCAMSDNAKQGVTNSLGVHHQLENLSIHDGSLFPTSIGANPQLSIYALCALLSNNLLQRFTPN